MGAMLLEKGVEYFNPDEATRHILNVNRDISQEEANSDLVDVPEWAKPIVAAMRLGASK